MPPWPIIAFCIAGFFVLLFVWSLPQRRGNQPVTDRPPPTEPPPKPEGYRDPYRPKLAWRHQAELPSMRFRLDIVGDEILVTVEDQRDPRDWSAFAIADGGVFVMNVTPDDLA